jgi:cAMP and cAMP-inhibited cGMP 3',5'-cyclic phosphodiesterase 10
VLGNIKHCILATDLALFFPNKARLANILKEGAFSWDLPDHRQVIHSLVMPNTVLGQGWARKGK